MSGFFLSVLQNLQKPASQSTITPSKLQVPFNSTLQQFAVSDTEDQHSVKLILCLRASLERTPGTQRFLFGITESFPIPSPHGPAYTSLSALAAGAWTHASVLVSLLIRLCTDALLLQPTAWPWDSALELTGLQDQLRFPPKETTQMRVRLCSKSGQCTDTWRAGHTEFCSVSCGFVQSPFPHTLPTHFSQESSNLSA